MPLLKGKKNVGRNIKELESTGKFSDKQSIAIALNKAGMSKKQKDRLRNASPVRTKRK